MVAARRAELAASLAKAEATRAREQIRSVTAGVELTDLRGYTREAIARLDAETFDAALICLQMVREGLARMSRSEMGSSLTAPAEWRAMDGQLDYIADAVRQLASVEPVPLRLDLAPIVRRLLEIGTRLARMQAVAESRATGD